MLIYILENTDRIASRRSIEQHITSAGHTTTDNIETADLAIGLLEDSWPDDFPPEKMIILHESEKVTEVFGEMVIVNANTLTMRGSPSQTLCEWLQTAAIPH